MPTSFFIGGIARRVDQHLLLGGHGNYAPLGIMDWLFGTSIGDELEDDMPEQSNGESIAEKLAEKKPRRSHRRKTRENVHT